MVNNKKLMGEKNTFPKITLKYPTLDAFAKFCRKGFQQGRASLKLKKDFQPGQRLKLNFQLGDRDQPVEIIGQVIDRVESPKKDGIIYGIRFLNFTEKKLNRLLAGEEITPRKKKEKPTPAEPPPKKEEAQKPAPKEKAQASEPAPAEKTPAPKPEKVEAPKKGVPSKEEEIEEVVITLQPQPQGFDGRIIETKPSGTMEIKEEQPEPEAPLPPAPQEPEEAEISHIFTEEQTPEPEAQKEVSLPPLEEVEPVKEFEEEIEEKAEPVPGSEMPSAEPETVEEKATPPPEEPCPELEEEKAEEIPTTEPAEEPEEIAEPETVSEAGSAELEEATELAPEETSQLTKETITREPEIAEAPEEEKPAEEFKPLPAKPFSDFLFRLVRTILNPPNPELPDTEKQFGELYQLFQELMESRQQLGIYLVLSPAGKDFLIQGAEEKPKSIRILLPSDQLGTLLFRMIEMFDEKELVGILFRKYVSEEHFQKFLLTLGKFNPEKESPDQLALNLIKQGIYYITPIFETDLVAVPEQVSEEAKIILARINGELKRLNALCQEISEEPLALLTLRLEEILKLARTSQLIAQVLEHLPLVWSEQVPEMDFSDLEEQILFSLPIERLIESSQLLIKKLIQLSSGKLKPEQEKQKKRLEQILRKLLGRIAYEAPEDSLEPLRQLFEKKIISYQELPAEIRDPIASSQLAEEFLKNPEEKLNQLEQAQNPADYPIIASQLLWASLALLKMGKIDYVQKLFNTLVAHYQEKSPSFPERKKLARNILQKYSEPLAVEILLKVLEEGKKEERELASSMLYAGGVGSAKKLVNLLEKSPDRQVRRLICEILARFGEKVAPLLAKTLSEPELPWYLVRNLVMILSQIKSPVIKERVEEFLNHPHPRVREEALGYTNAVLGKEAEPVLLKALSDEELSVKLRAINYLSRTEEITPEILEQIKKIIDELLEKEIQAEGELCFQRAVDLLARSREEKFADGDEINDYLLKILETATPKGIFARAGLELSPKMKASLAQALGKRKVKKAQKLLSKLAKDKEEQTRQSAQKALEELKS